MRLPSFIIIGAQKAGTTSLQWYLRQTPGVFLPGRESTHYFTNHFDKPLEWYKSLFIEHNNKVVGECTRFYCMHPLVPPRMKEVIPNVKIIFLLRNPVARAYSHYQDKIRLRLEKKAKTFEEAIELEEERTKEEWDIMLKGKSYRHGAPYREFTYLTKGRYVEQLKRWYKYFPKEQIMVIQSERFFKDTNTVFNEVLQFIGANPHKVHNPKAYNRYPYKQPINPETREKLIEYFKPYNEELFKLIGRRFDWT